MPMRPRVLLIAPPLRIMKQTRSKFSKNVHRRAHPLIGLGLLATVLNQRGYPVQYLDTAIHGIDQTTPFDDATDYYGLTPEQVFARADAFQPDIIGIGCLSTSQFPLVTMLSRAFKKSKPHIPIVVGGNHATLNWQTVMQEPSIDYILKGEGEFLLPELIDAIMGQVPMPRATIFRQKGAVIETPGVERISHMDELPWYNFDLVPLQEYWDRGLPQAPFAKSKKAILYETSRGCPERCIFCSTMQFFGHKFRPKSATRVIDEITGIVKKHGVEEVQFSDDNIALNLKRFVAICEGLQGLGLHLCAPNGIRFDYKFHEDADIRPVYASMKAAGFYQITFAPESGNEHMLNEVIGKRLDLKKMARLVAIARDEFDFRTHAFFVIGFPHETRQQMQDTFDYALALGADSYSVAVATPFPPTELWQWCQRENLLHEGINEGDLLFGRPVIRRLDDMTEEQVQELAETMAETLNTRRPHA